MLSSVHVTVTVTMNVNGCNCSHSNDRASPSENHIYLLGYNVVSSVTPSEMSLPERATMARHRIHDDNGKPTDYFWSDKYSADRTRAQVFKETEEGIKRMKNVFFDTVKRKLMKER